MAAGHGLKVVLRAGEVRGEEAWATFQTQSIQYEKKQSETGNGVRVHLRIYNLPSHLEPNFMRELH